jgi:acyl-coenzyme A synthetase/AMP-(fatty) acid ligase
LSRRHGYPASLAEDIIITAGGKNITPANLEQALHYNRWISQAVVIGDGRRIGSRPPLAVRFKE